MAIDMIGTVATNAPPPNASSAMGQDDFLKILMTQLTYQDPLKPLDNQEFIAQMAQFTALEQTRQMNDKLDSMLNSQAVLQSFGLVGKNIEYQTPTGTSTGKITAVSFGNGQPLLTAQGDGGQLDTQIKLSSIVTVRN